MSRRFAAIMPAGHANCYKQNNIINSVGWVYCGAGQGILRRFEFMRYYAKLEGLLNKNCLNPDG
jgi:hypothetical protein